MAYRMQYLKGRRQPTDGRQVDEQEFKEACEAFRKAPVNGSMEDKEAKG